MILYLESNPLVLIGHHIAGFNLLEQGNMGSSLALVLHLEMQIYDRHMWLLVVDMRAFPSSKAAESS